MVTNNLAGITKKVRDGAAELSMLDQVPKLGAFGKGKGQCKVEGEHDCAGQNACKGHGGCKSPDCP